MSSHALPHLLQTTPLLAGLAVGAAAYAARMGLQAYQSFKTAGPRMRSFYKGGFLQEMTRREASLILGEPGAGERTGTDCLAGRGAAGLCSALWLCA